MDFSNLLERASLNSLRNFLAYGGESFEKLSEKTYLQRITDARKNATEFFKARYSDMNEYDEIAGYFDEQVAVVEDVYFEIGLILGGKIGLQVGEKINELG